MIEEARHGGLIDKYWFLEIIIVPLLLLCVIIGIIYIIIINFNCPYTEDVSSCFPYNLPNWAKLSLPLFVIIIPVIIFLIIKFVKTNNND